MTIRELYSKVRLVGNRYFSNKLRSINMMYSSIESNFQVDSLEQEKLEFIHMHSNIFSVMPIQQHSKNPVEKWQQWQKQKRPFAVEDFINKNAAFICGKISNLLVLDVDHVELFKSFLWRNNLSIPRTFTVKTGKQGYHYYFTIEDDIRVFHKKAIKTLGIDIQGEGSYVLTPYSIHPETEKQYKVCDESAMVAPPEWLVEMTLNKTPKKWSNVNI